MGGSIKILTFDEVIVINRKAIIIDPESLYTESDLNLLSRGSLELIIDEITFPIFGQERFPTVYQKAAALCWRIIEGHIFRDGNKRTGLLCLMTMLEMNGYQLNCGDKEALDKALAIAVPEGISLDEFTQWVSEYIIPYSVSPSTPSGIDSLASYIIESK